MRRLRTRLGVLLTAAMVITGIPIPAMAYVSEISPVQEGSVIEESTEPVIADAEAEGADGNLLTEDVMSDTLMQFEEEEGAEMSLKSLADQYDTAYNDTTGEDIKIIYVSDNQTVLSSDAAERLEKADEGRDRRIKIGEDGVVTQVFNRDDEDKLAPNVYVHEDGKKARGERTWYVTVKGKEFIGEFNYHDIVNEFITVAGEGLPGYIAEDMGGGSSYKIYRITDVKKYLSADSIVKQAQTYQSGGTVRLYPNWQTPVDVIFDEESLKGAENPNSGIIDYVPYEKLKLDPLEDVPGYAFKGWKYKFEGETGLKEAEAGTGSDEGKFIIDTQNNSRILTVYADWDPVKYSITYKGVKVIPVSGNSTDSNNDTFNFDGVEMEVVSDSIGDMIDPESPSIAGITLPTYFTVDETTTLPTADQINANLTNLDPDFTKYNEFMCWSRSRKFKNTVNTLGKEGDVLYGNTVLYVIYTSRELIPELSANKVAADKEFSVEQVNILDLLDTDDYAIINICGNSLSADPDTIVLSGNAAKYFELCKVDARKAGTGHGYATFGIKLRDKDDEGKVIDDAVVKDIQKKGDLRKLTLRFTGIDKRKDEKGEPVLYEPVLTLKTSYKLPKYKLKSSKGTIYTTISGKNKAGFLVSEKEGNLTTDSYSGSWKADYVVKNGNTYETVSASEISVTVRGNDFAIEAGKACKDGKIRLRNTGWVKGAYVYLPYKIVVNDKAPVLALTDKDILLNTEGNNEVSTTTVTFKDGMKLDPSNVSLDKSKLPDGISADHKNGIITVKRTGAVKKGTYKLTVNYKGLKKGVQLTVKVKDTKPDKAVKMTVKGKLDALMGGSLYLIPKVNGYAGTIKDVSVVTAAGKVPEFDTVWSGGFVELYSTYDYKPSEEKREINLNVTMTTGQVLPYLLKVTPSKGRLRLNVYDAAIKVPEKAEGDTGIREVKAYTPVIVTYFYEYSSSPTTKAKRMYTIDMTRDSSADLIEINEAKGDSNNEISASYSKGVITLTNKIDVPEKNRNYRLKVTAVLKPFKNMKSNCTYLITLRR